MSSCKKLCKYYIRGTCKYGSICSYYHPPKLNGFLLIILGKQILLGYSKTKKCFDIFGGKCEDYDISPYHTAIREFIEEFFNFKPTVELVSTIVCESNILRSNGFYNEKSKALVFKINTTIFQNIINILKKELELSLPDNYFSICMERPTPTIDPYDGLYSIEYVKLFNHDELKNIKIRPFANFIINKFN